MTLLWALAVAFVACVPAAVTRPQFTAASSGAAVDAFRARFAPLFNELGVEVGGGRAFEYSGDDPLALAAATDAFYIAHPGFCPVADGFFYLAEEKLYVTLAARERDVAVFGYDLSRAPAISVVHLEGRARKAFTVLPCRTGGPSR